MTDADGNEIDDISDLNVVSYVFDNMWHIIFWFVDGKISCLY